jgi:hypothetical protein
VIVNFSGLSNAPACHVAGVTARPGANGMGCEQPPVAVEPTVKLLLAVTGALPEYGVKELVVVAVPQDSGFAKGAVEPPLR